ncbi:MAG: class I SAM-dependent methyltransferase [Bacteroidales bacterium]|nr:MAG: class I SAM-dependent methyltransferase [Bacteroidales bacterium]
MIEYWESRFSNEGAMWKFEPSDSAVAAMNLFKSNSIRKILIPGCGYGRNTKIFYNNGFEITGIEISKSAIEIAKENGLNCKFHHGSVASMPFDNDQYEGIFCYALIHLLNRTERRAFLESCYNQLKVGGLMFFVIASKAMSLYGSGRFLSKDRYEISKGLKVFFYDQDSTIKEFSDFGIVEFKEIEEPVKYMVGQEPIKLIQVICKKR